MRPSSLLQASFVAPFLLAATLRAQSIQVEGAREFPGEQSLTLSPQPPEPELATLPAGDVSLLPGLFRTRRELTKAYVLRLDPEKLLQNFYLEAGVRLDLPYDQFYQGWEAPSCQLRGHFAGHWLSSAERFAALDHDPVLAARAKTLVHGLEHCQKLNGGTWVGSIPEKYFDILADGREWIWSPQYTLHKTMMGLFDAYRFGHDKEALAVLERSADWFSAWTAKMIREGRGKAVYGGECAGMLELWANLYGATKDPRYLRLASRYAMPDLFRDLLAGGDPLTNNHANASIPWMQGAARLYEVTGDVRYRRIVELFWNDAVVKRGMFATTGGNAGEFWIPPGQFGRFLGSRTQEHCTVYNMIRVAQYLFRWTGDSRYADYIERALYNGILAQQNPNTGLVCYFLPLAPGSRKVWGSETHDFWCCHGTLVQAQALYESLIYCQSPDGIAVSQFIPSKASFTIGGQPAEITLQTDDSDRGTNFANADNDSRFVVALAVHTMGDAPWTLRIRQPSWALGPGSVSVDGAPVPASVDQRGFIALTRTWKDSRVRVAFAKRVTEEPLPGDERRVALLDGPVVLAALTANEASLSQVPDLAPQYEHVYEDGRDWQSRHYLLRTGRGTVPLKPLYEIADETYSVYFDRAR